jgi:heme oxygenase
MSPDHPIGILAPIRNDRPHRDIPARDGLVMALRQRTKGLHVEAERAGIIRDLLRGTVSRPGYALLLRNLLPAYQALEAGLERHRGTTLLANLARPEVYRAASIETDLTTLAGPAWRDVLPLLESGQNYANRVTAAAAGDGARLLAHAYTRFLGDLSGGRVLAARLETRLPGVLRFYEFPLIADPGAFKATYLTALDHAGRLVADTRAIIEEAADAFMCNIHLAEAVKAATLASPSR